MSDSKRLSADQVGAMAATVGVTISDAVATRIAGAVAPTISGFAAISEKLPFDAEPASFVVAQNRSVKA
jgi:hypothetical protein